MQIQVTENRASIEAARAVALAAERAAFEGVFQKIEAHSPGDEQGPFAEDSRDWLTQAERGAVRRNRDVALPRLLSIAEGRHHEGERKRLIAAVILGLIDPDLGFRSVLGFLNSTDPAILGAALEELSYGLLADDDGWGTNPSRLREPDAARIFALLGHPDNVVAASAVNALGRWKPPGTVERLLPLFDDPVLWRWVRCALANDGRREETLDRAIAALNEQTSGEPIGDYLNIVQQFAIYCTDKQIAGRARAAMLAHMDQASLEPRVRAWEELDSIRAKRPANLERGAAVIEGLVSSDLLDAGVGRDAIATLRAMPDGQWSGDPAWLATAIFKAARLQVEFEGGSDDPPSYDEVIRELEAASPGAFRPEAIFQLRGTGMDDIPIQFVHRDRLYRFSAAYHDDDVDTEAIVAAANVALRDAGDPRRFVPLRSARHAAGLAFIEPERLRAIAEAIGIEPGEVATPEVVIVDALGDPSAERLRIAFRKLMPGVGPGLTDVGSSV